MVHFISLLIPPTETEKGTLHRHCHKTGAVWVRSETGVEADRRASSLSKATEMRCRLCMEKSHSCKQGGTETHRTQPPDFQKTKSLHNRTGLCDCFMAPARRFANAGSGNSQPKCTIGPTKHRHHSLALQGGKEYSARSRLHKGKGSHPGAPSALW